MVRGLFTLSAPCFEADLLVFVVDAMLARALAVVNEGVVAEGAVEDGVVEDGVVEDGVVEPFVASLSPRVVNSSAVPTAPPPLNEATTARGTLAICVLSSSR
jgi:hypothetical protein